MDSVAGHGLFGSYDEADLEAWVVSGASGRGFDDDLRAVLRAQLLCAALGSSFGTDVERGLSREGLGAALALAARPSRDWGEHGAKRVALRFHATSCSSTDLVAVMVRAALRHDERRLARALPAARVYSKADGLRRGVDPAPDALRRDRVGVGANLSPTR